MNKKTSVITALILLTGFLITTTLWALTPTKTQTLEAHVKIADYVGVNLDTDKLYFGTLKPGSTADRSISIKTSNKAVTTITTKGEISDWLIASKTIIKTTPGKEENIKFTIITPKNATKGNHTGTIIVKTYPWIAGIIIK